MPKKKEKNSEGVLLGRQKRIRPVWLSPLGCAAYFVIYAKESERVRQKKKYSLQSWTEYVKVLGIASLYEIGDVASENAISSAGLCVPDLFIKHSR